MKPTLLNTKDFDNGNIKLIQATERATGRLKSIAITSFFGDEMKAVAVCQPDDTPNTEFVKTLLVNKLNRKYLKFLQSAILKDMDFIDNMLWECTCKKDVGTELLETVNASLRAVEAEYEAL